MEGWGQEGNRLALFRTASSRTMSVRTLMHGCEAPTYGRRRILDDTRHNAVTAPLPYRNVNAPFDLRPEEGLEERGFLIPGHLLDPGTHPSRRPCTGGLRRSAYRCK